MIRIEHGCVTSRSPFKEIVTDRLTDRPTDTVRRPRGHKKLHYNENRMFLDDEIKNLGNRSDFIN